MSSVWKRTWSGRDGAERAAWCVDYQDGEGRRRRKTFARKKDATAFSESTAVSVRAGTHTPERASPTVEKAWGEWLKEGEADGLETSTLRQRRQHLAHLKPIVGGTRLSLLTGPGIVDVEAKLRDGGMSPATRKKVIASLGTLLAFAQARGWVATNAVRAGARRKRKSRDRQALDAGITIPSKAEIRSLIDAATGRWRPLVVTAIFAGLRASELRGLRWSDVDLDAKVLRVRQRADAWGSIGAPKSAAGTRDVPLAPMVVNALREWRLACPKGDLDLVFPNGSGNVESMANITNRGWWPLQIRAGVTRDTGERDAEGNAILAPKYRFHDLRHVAASLLIESGLSPKRVQSIMGHSSITMTFDLYGKLFPSPEDDAAALDRMQARLLA